MTLVLEEGLEYSNQLIIDLVIILLQAYDSNSDLYGIDKYYWELIESGMNKHMRGEESFAKGLESVFLRFSPGRWDSIMQEGHKRFGYLRKMGNALLIISQKI